MLNFLTDLFKLWLALSELGATTDLGLFPLNRIVMPISATYFERRFSQWRQKTPLSPFHAALYKLRKRLAHVFFLSVYIFETNEEDLTWTRSKKDYLLLSNGVSMVHSSLPYTNKQIKSWKFYCSCSSVRCFSCAPVRFYNCALCISKYMLQDETK